MAYFPNSISFGDNGSIDANGRLRVVNPYTSFSSTFKWNTSSLDWSTTASVGSSVTHLPNEAACLLTIGTNNGDICIHETKAYSRGVAGKSYNFMASINFGANGGATNVTKSVGFGDDNNGYFLEQAGNNINFVQRLKTSGTVKDTAISQSSWNVDVMNGSGVSGKNLDFSKIQTVSFDSYWPSGRVRCGFRIDGMRYTAHQFMCANTLAGPNITMPNLPVRFMLKNYGASAGATMKAYHASCRMEGGIQEPGKYFATCSSGLTAVTTRRPIVSIRPKQFYNGIVNRGNVELAEAILYTTDNACKYEVVYNGTLTGASWKDYDTRYSMVEADFSATAISNGVTIETEFNAAASTSKANFNTSMTTSLISKLPICLSDVSGSENSGIVITLVCTSMNGTSNNGGGFCWLEFI